MYNSVTYNSLIRLIMGGDHHRHQSNLSYECNYGYMIIGETVRRCERNKVWTGLQPICRGRPDHIHATCCSWNHVDQQSHILIKITILSKSEINCGSPGILPNGWLEGSRTTLHAVVTFRSSNIFNCHHNHSIIIKAYKTMLAMQCNASLA